MIATEKGHLSPKFSSFVYSLIRTTLERWSMLSSSPAPQEPTFTLRDQRTREDDLRRSFADIRHHIDEGIEYPANDREALRRAITDIVKRSCEHPTVRYSDNLLDGFWQSTDAFIHHATSIAPDLTAGELYQAVRNMWIVNSIQIYLDEEARMTPAGFAYSMLYPVTDNVLDDPGLDPVEKSDFNARLERRLTGMATPSPDTRDELCSRLVSMIEEEYPRQEYRTVYQGILSIFYGQCASLQTQDSSRSFDEHELLLISAEKGGTSVLADAYLVDPFLSSADIAFFFRYGFLLQLCDDLQDLTEDMAAGHQTIFSKASAPLDQLTGNLARYMNDVFADAARFSSPRARELCTLSRRACRLLMLEAISRHSERFSSSYLKHMEQSSPVRLAFLREYRRQIMERYTIPIVMKTTGASGSRMLKKTPAPGACAT